MDDTFATAKWANRMLRPLTSLHHRLGKYRELQSIDAAQRHPGRVNPAASTSVTTSQTSTTKRLVAGNGNGQQQHESDHGDDHDPSWIPGESDKRRVKHKYVARGERLGRRARVRLVVRSPEAVRTLPGAIEIATPLITGRSTYVTGQQRGETSGSGGNTSEMDPQSPTGKQAVRTGRAPRQSRFPRPDTQWRASLDSAKDANYVDIVQRLDVLFLKFLEKTGLPDSRNPRSTGTSRSLLLTVMRRLPEFIAEEQRLQDELDDVDDVDMVDVYFTELESAYGSTAKGWQPLREAVRSQGVFLVCNMVQNSWITPYTASTLINKCIDAGENDAVESLLAAQLGKLEHYNFPDSFDSWRSAGSVRDPIRLLHKYWVQSRNHAYIYAQLEQLLSRRVLPTEWMVTTPWKACVVAATNSVSCGDRECAVGTELMEAVLKSAAGVSWISNISGVVRTSRIMHADLEENSHIRTPQPNGASSEQGRCPVYIHDALSNLVSSLVVALCGMCFVRMEQHTSLEDGSYARVANMLSSLALSTARELSLEQMREEDDEPTEAQFLRRGYVLLGYCLLRCRQDPQFQDCDGKEAILDENCESFFALLDDKSEIIKELSGMVGQVVRCCERGEGAQCRRARRLCTQLLGFEQLGHTKLTLFLAKIAVEVALDFAQYSQDAEDHAYAGDIQDTVRAMRARLSSDVESDMKQRSKDTSMQSFRWEEGIGEWVAKTPLDRSKSAAAVSRVFAQPIVEIVRGNSPSSDSGEEAGSASSPSSSLSIASTATSLSLKRTRVDEDDEPYYHHNSTKRPRRGSTNRRHSARISVQEKTINDTEEEDEESDDVDSLSSSSSESEDELSYGIGHTRRFHSEPRTANKNMAVQALPQANGLDFEIVIYNNHKAPIAAPSPPRPKRRGPGRPPKQESRRVSMQAVVQPRRSLQHPLVIPCSEDEESDDELSFLN
jgi:hypothetical protein